MADTSTDDLLADLQAVLDGTGRHAAHERRLTGRCVRCSCGERVQFNGAPPADLVADAPPKPGRVREWQVRLADGFVCFKGDAKWRANEIAAKHDGATVEPATAAPAT